MATSNFQLQSSLAEFLNSYKKEKTFTTDDLEELKSHLLDSVDELQSKGLAVDEAFLIATKRLGPKEEVSMEFKKLDRGPILSAETFWIVYGLFVFTILFFLQRLSVIFATYLSFETRSDIGIFFIRLSTIVPVCIVGYFLIVNRKVFTWIESKFSAKPLDVFVLTFFTIVVFWFVWYFGEGFLTDQLIVPHIRSHGNGLFVFDNRFSYFSFFAPAILVIFVFVRLLYPAIRDKKLGSLFDKFGYLGLFVLGIGINFLAALPRFTGGDLSIFAQAGIFGIIFGTCILLATRAISKDPLKKILVLSSFTVIGEFIATWNNPALTQGTPLSLFFYATILGGVSGFLAGKKTKAA